MFPCDGKWGDRECDGDDEKEYYLNYINEVSKAAATSEGSVYLSKIFSRKDFPGQKIRPVFLKIRFALIGARNQSMLKLNCLKKPGPPRGEDAKPRVSAPS